MKIELKNGKKTTVNNLAKYFVYEKGESAEYWEEMYNYKLDVNTLTERQKDAIYVAVLKQIARVKKAFKIDDFINEILN